MLVILGHANTDSLCGALAAAYARGAATRGAEVRELHLGSLSFDPILRRGYAAEQPLEPDLLDAQEAIRRTDHLVFIHPNWWGGMPALLKGFIDRVFIPGFAFRYRSGSPLWDRLLAGRTAEIIVTMDSPGWYYRWIVGRPGIRQLKKAILDFCGIRVTRITRFGPVRGSDDARRRQWLEKAEMLGRRA